MDVTQRDIRILFRLRLNVRDTVAVAPDFNGFQQPVDCAYAVGLWQAGEQSQPAPGHEKQQREQQPQ